MRLSGVVARAASGETLPHRRPPKAKQPSILVETLLRLSWMNVRLVNRFESGRDGRAIATDHLRGGPFRARRLSLRASTVRRFERENRPGNRSNRFESGLAKDRRWSLRNRQMVAADLDRSYTLQGLGARTRGLHAEEAERRSPARCSGGWIPAIATAEKFHRRRKAEPIV